MPYRTNDDLPPSVRRSLPAHARSIYREAFNHAFGSYSDNPRREEIAHRIAWAAVKQSYVKTSRGWLSRGSFDSLPHDSARRRP